jgi:hypothetical protein
MTNDVLELNTVNIGAVGLALVDLNTVLSILVLVTALIYNITKIVKKQW